MQGAKNGPGNRRKCQLEKTIGPATVQVIPTKHFKKRFEQRVGDLVPKTGDAVQSPTSGVLVQSRRPGFFYLDVPGIGRFVLREEDGHFKGITVLPQLHCHDLSGVS